MEVNIFDKIRQSFSGFSLQSLDSPYSEFLVRVFGREVSYEEASVKRVRRKNSSRRDLEVVPSKQ